MKLFPNFTSIPSDYLLISQVTNHVCNRGFFTCLSCFYRIDREHHALKSLELKFGLSLEFSEFCIGNSMISSTQGARDFSSAVSGFCQVFIVTRAKSLLEQSAIALMGPIQSLARLNQLVQILDKTADWLLTTT